MQSEDEKEGHGYQLFNGSTLQLIKDIIHVWLPQDMRCIILQPSRSFSKITYSIFPKTHAYQLETIPGIKDMIAKYK